MRKGDAFGIALLAVVALGDGASAQGLPDSARAVRAAETAFAGAMAARDLEAFAAHIASEAVFFGGSGVLRGREAVVAGWRHFFEAPSAPFSWSPEEVEVLDSGELALSSGPVFDPRGRRIGTFNSVWRREGDGRWRVVFDKGCPPCDCDAAADPSPVDEDAGPPDAASVPSIDASAAASELAALLHERSSVAALGATRFSSTREPWKPTGVRVVEGQGVTLFGFGANVGRRVWVRIGDADVVNLGEETWSFPAWATGEIELAAPPPGTNWERCDGTLPAAAASLPAEPLDMAVVAVAWNAPPRDALAGLPAGDAIARARADLERQRPLPAGFRSVCYLPRTNVFEAWEDDGRRGVWGDATSSAGIIKKAIDLPLDAASEIRFEWRYDALHALGPETDARHHDYSSIAVEFDNGQDITWMRSPHLESGTIFRCPLPWWDQRETHLVLQGGRDDLGVWQSHTRRILDDYQRAVGGPPPKRIVGVWFISVGVFGGTTPDAKFANVVLRSGGKTVDVFDDGESIAGPP